MSSPAQVFSGPVGNEGKAFLRQVEGCWARSIAAQIPQEILLRIGGRGCRLVFASPALTKAMSPAFAHLTSNLPSGEDGFTINLWDTVSGGETPPSLSMPERRFPARGEINHAFGDIQVSFRLDSTVLSVSDHSRRTAWCWVRDPAHLPPWECAAPLRPILSWWAARTGGQLAHAAAVGTGEGAVLLAARGGSGKSTTALACLERGLLYLGDDYVMVDPGTPPWVSSLYATAKVTPANLGERLPRLSEYSSRLHDVHQEKVTLHLWDGFRPQLTPSLPLHAVVIPSVAPDGQLSVSRASAIQALAALAPTTVFQLPHSGAAAVERLASIVRAVPCFRLVLARDLSKNVDAILAILRDTA